MKRTEFQKKRSGVDDHCYENILKAQKSKGIATESQIAWLENGMKEPNKLTPPKKKDRFDFFRATARHIKKPPIDKTI